MAANPERGEFGVEIGGRPYVLVLTFNALIDLQNLLAVGAEKPSPEEIWKRCERNDLEAVRGLFWALLRRHHPSVTVEQAGDLVQEAGGSGALAPLLSESGKASNPDPRDVAALGGAAENPPKVARRRGTGARSNSPAGDAA